MKIDLTGKRAVVTASTSGIGLAIAKGLLGAGASVVVNGRRTEVTDAAVAALQAQFPGSAVMGISADLANKDEVDRFVAIAADADILVNNLGTYDRVGFFDIPDSEWYRFMDTNLFSGVWLSRHYMPGMLERNWGRLIFITSESGITPPATRIHYGVSKAAQMALAKGLAETARGTGVTSNTIVVGVTRTEQIEAMVGHMAQERGISKEQVEREMVAEHRPTQLLERLASSEEVANMVVYVASPQASATTGAALRVEGGGIPTIL